MVEEQGANAQTSPPETMEGAIASSPEAMVEAQEKVTEQPTPQQGETPPVEEGAGETPLHENPRFKEVIDEKNWYKQQLEQTLQRTPQQPPQQPVDPDAGRTPEEKVFWEQVRREAAKSVSPQIQAGIQEIAQLRATLFQRDHPDVKEGSPEYQQIVHKISSGYLPDDAYKAVMWDKKVAAKSANVQQQQQQRLQAKKQANVVSPSSVSSQSVPPKKMTFEEEMTHKLNNEWDGTI